MRVKIAKKTAIRAPSPATRYCECSCMLLDPSIVRHQRAGGQDMSLHRLLERRPFGAGPQIETGVQCKNVEIIAVITRFGRRVGRDIAGFTRGIPAGDTGLTVLTDASGSRNIP